jgi:hypothetical protein
MCCCIKMPSSSPKMEGRQRCFLIAIAPGSRSPLHLQILPTPIGSCSRYNVLSKLAYSTPLIAALSEAIFIVSPTRHRASYPLRAFRLTSPAYAPNNHPKSPTVGPAPKDFFTISHGLGGTTVPLTVTQTFESMDWSTVTISNPPPAAPPPAYRTETPVPKNSRQPRPLDQKTTPQRHTLPIRQPSCNPVPRSYNLT